MKVINLFIAVCFCVVAATGCTRSKPTAETTSAPAVNNSKTESPAAPAASSASDAHAGELPNAPNQTQDELHTPEKGSAERQAIMDALRGSEQVQFKVNYLKVHNGWAWVDTTPLDKKGQATAEGGPNLLHLENGNWKVMDLNKVPDDPNDPLGPEDASPTYVKNLMKTFPGVPKDIFPKPSK